MKKNKLTGCLCILLSLLLLYRIGYVIGVFMANIGL